jgi:hypothetical protein
MERASLPHCGQEAERKRPEKRYPQGSSPNHPLPPARPYLLVETEETTISQNYTTSCGQALTHKPIRTFHTQTITLCFKDFQHIFKF